MGIRETLNRNPGVVTGATIVIIVVVLGFIVMQLTSSNVPKAPTQSFYTVDDGVTRFGDDVNLVPPFKTKDGKEAVRVYVFSCKNGKAPFPVYMERYLPEGKAKIEALMKKGNVNSDERQGLDEKYKQVKKVGGAKWCSLTDPGFGDVTRIDCPDNNYNDLIVVTP